MEYAHKIETREGTEIALNLQESGSGIQVVVGTAPVNLAAAPEQSVNTPIVCKTFDEARSALGYSPDFKNYTICEAMDLSFRKFGLSPVIFINVLDPKKHKKAMDAVSGTVENNQLIIKTPGILLNSLVVTADSQTLKKNEDYVAEFDESGNLVLAFTAERSAVTVAADVIDPSAVTESDVIGGYNAGTGEETGLEAVRQVYPKTGYVFEQLVCPRWSANKNVAAVMAEKVVDINGLFQAIAVVDVSATTYTKHTALKTVKADMGVSGSRCVLVWPKLKYGDTVYDYSAAWAAASAWSDIRNGGVPHNSPSNLPLGASAAVLDSGKEVYLDHAEAALVNSYGIVTALNDGGFKSWGNETAAFPEDRSIGKRYISSARMMNWYRNRFITAYRDKVDEPTNIRLVEAFVDAENQYLNGLVAGGYLPSGSHIAYNEGKNPKEKILDGEIVFDTEIAFWPPAKHIVNEVRFNPTLIISALAGGNE